MWWWVRTESRRLKPAGRVSWQVYFACCDMLSSSTRQWRTPKTREQCVWFSFQRTSVDWKCLGEPDHGWCLSACWIGSANPFPVWLSNVCRHPPSTRRLEGPESLDPNVTLLHYLEDQGWHLLPLPFSGFRKLVLHHFFHNNIALALSTDHFHCYSLNWSAKLTTACVA